MVVGGSLPSSFPLLLPSHTKDRGQLDVAVFLSDHCTVSLVLTDPDLKQGDLSHEEGGGDGHNKLT